MAMTAEEVRYPDIYLETPVPAQRKSPEKSERGDPSFGFAEYFTECRRGGASSDARGEGSSTSTSGGAVKLTAQVKELQAKLAERSSELEAIKERNKLMEEHIESVGADREGIVKVNVRVVLYAFLFVIAALVTAVGVVFHWEAVGAPVARALAGKWGAACDETCAASPASETQSNGGFFSWGRR